MKLIARDGQAEFDQSPVRRRISDLEITALVQETGRRMAQPHFLKVGDVVAQIRRSGADRGRYARASASGVSGTSRNFSSRLGWDAA
ncbi:hypothetical protein [Ancylobacter vacuolatus]|uniref:Uncharacterized protein n=1 Tax=Ancylobacter vacuolatus TaxID=223389 RepID=A0ABU0DB97_9HYPH|nr:hypothetical protein [Ancylobacter vacuolatus]MDQ0345689.1 hypothetical protein [Ancylobacter vacuolatus]